MKIVSLVLNSTLNSTVKVLTQQLYPAAQKRPQQA